MKPSRDSLTRSLAFVVCVCLLLSVAAAPASAGDVPTILQIQPTEQQVEPGENFTVDLVLTSDGGYGDVQVRSANVTVTYTEGVTASSVEHGPWFERSESQPTREHEIDAEAREVSVYQSLEEGATGGAVTYATLSFESDDEFTGNVTLHPRDVNVTLTNDLPVESIGHNATVYVGEAGVGDDEREDADSDDGGPTQPGFHVAAAAAALFAVLARRLRR